MNFFQQQEVARRNTGRLVVLFVLAVIGIIFLVHVSASISFGMLSFRTTPDHLMRGEAIQTHDLLFDYRMFLAVTGATILIVSFGSLYKIAELRGGGTAVAEMLGGKLVDPGTPDPDLRRLLNVVEEMALASGTSVPPVYLMENERTINAFAAGNSPHDAVIGVTRGTVQTLDRDELQGVIAHEFSHILNGDMRLNIRLIGVLHGILVIGLIGSVILRSFLYAGSRRGGPVPLLAIGAALVAIGYIGTFFGRLIKAAVSRQREYLADASAVQFTRLPDGIAGALKKIGGLRGGSRLVTPRAEEASHMFFGAAIRFQFMTMYATHPPLEARIRRIEPGWDGQFPEVALRGEVPQNETLIADLQRGGAAAAPAVVVLGVDQMLDSIGRPTAEHLAYAGRLLAAIPEQTREASETSFGARAIVLAMLLDKEASVRTVQWARLSSGADEQTVAATGKIENVVESMRDELKLPLIDLCMPALRELSPAQYAAFREVVLDLVRADDRVDPFEWMVKRSVIDHLDRHFGRRRPAVVRYYGLARLGPMLSALLSSLAYAGHDDLQDARRAFEAGAARLEDGAEVTMVPPTEALGLTDLDDVIDTLVTMAPPLKRRVLAACVACILADRQVTVREAEFVRAFADALECPMPPLLPGQRLGGLV